MQTEAVPGGPGFGRACRIHHSWKAQNAIWDPVAAGLVSDVALLDLSECAPHLSPLSPASSTGDPHLAFAHGGTADFRGCEGCYFNMLSMQDLLVNVRTSLATFELKGSTVHGWLYGYQIGWQLHGGQLRPGKEGHPIIMFKFQCARTWIHGQSRDAVVEDEGVAGIMAVHARLETENKAITRSHPCNQPVQPAVPQITAV